LNKLTVGVVTKLVNVDTVLAGCQTGNGGFDRSRTRLTLLREDDSILGWVTSLVILSANHEPLPIDESASLVRLGVFLL
jgi:hypothetical protein